MACFGSYRESISDDIFLTCLRHLLLDSRENKGLCSQRFHLASCEERNDNNHNVRSDNFLIYCLLMITTVSPGVSDLMSFPKTPKYIHLF